jgi:hypothetical protein
VFTVVGHTAKFVLVKIEIFGRKAELIVAPQELRYVEDARSEPK